MFVIAQIGNMQMFYEFKVFDHVKVLAEIDLHSSVYFSFPD